MGDEWLPLLHVTLNPFHSKSLPETQNEAGVAASPRLKGNSGVNECITGTFKRITVPEVDVAYNVPTRLINIQVINIELAVICHLIFRSLLAMPFMHAYTGTHVDSTTRSRQNKDDVNGGCNSCVEVLARWLNACLH